MPSGVTTHDPTPTRTPNKHTQMWEPVCSVDLRSEHEAQAGGGEQTAIALSEKSSVVGFSIAGCRGEGACAYAVAGALGGEVRAVRLPAEVGEAAEDVEAFKKLLQEQKR